MRKSVVAFAVVLATAALFGAPATAASTKRVPAATEFSSQNAQPPRARTRIRVSPARRTGKLVRECNFRLVREVRASGSYVVPRQHCWWARQRY